MRGSGLGVGGFKVLASHSDDVDVNVGEADEILHFHLVDDGLESDEHIQ